MPSNTKNTVADASATMDDKLSGAASQVKSKASHLGRLAADKIHDKADSLPGGQRVTSAANATANTLSSAADYIREKDVSSMMTDLARLVKNNPGPAMLCAAALGFMVARNFSDD